MGANVSNAPPDWESAFQQLSTQISALSTELASTKSALQTAISSNSGGGLKLTSAEYFSYSGGTGNYRSVSRSYTYGGVAYVYHEYGALTNVIIDGVSFHANCFKQYIGNFSSYIIPFASSISIDYYCNSGVNYYIAFMKYVKV